MTRRPQAIPDAAPPAMSRRGCRPNSEMRVRLIDAGGQVIGDHGYAGCSIARITARARIAHGGFYHHFDSRQAFFDAMLPTLGARLLRAIGRAVLDCRDLLELERRGFTAGFAYLRDHPYLFRVLFEAEQFARDAFTVWRDQITAGYVKALRRLGPGTPLARESDEALEALATMLIGARSQLLMRYAVTGGAVLPLSDAHVAAYIAFVAPRLTGATG
ncbi:MAG: TetR/AcrR family transcriptional regulator [Sphingomonas sp.]